MVECTDTRFPEGPRCIVLRLEIVGYGSRSWPNMFQEIEVMVLTRHRCNTKKCSGRESELCRVVDIEHKPILTWNALQIIPSTASSIDKRLDVVAIELILLDAVIADQLRSDVGDGGRIASVRNEREIFGGTFFDANLRGLASVQWNVIFGTLANVEEH